MAKPRLLGIAYAAKAASVVAEWRRLGRAGPDAARRLARAKLKSLRTFEARARMNPLAAGDPVARDRWPRDLARDYGADIPNLFRFELADRWRGYYALVGEPGGVRIWVLYVWDHPTYSRQSGYSDD
ncbi:MAG TPA: hypothetical protein VGR51_07220 [Thermoplasmata archaeon]|nr:hypothetical protein [Thermoplasmata archaeon]